MSQGFVWGGILVKHGGYVNYFLYYFYVYLYKHIYIYILWYPHSYIRTFILMDVGIILRKQYYSLAFYII